MNFFLIFFLLKGAGAPAKAGPTTAHAGNLRPGKPGPADPGPAGQSPATSGQATGSQATGSQATGSQATGSQATPGTAAPGGQPQPAPGKGGLPAQTQGAGGQAVTPPPGKTASQDQAPFPAFPNTPVAPPPRVQDIAVPPAPVTPGSKAPPQLDANAPLTADEAARIALLKQPSLGTSIGAIQIQNGQTKQTASALFPQVTVGAGIDEVRALPGASFPQTVEAPNVASVDGASPGYLFSTGAGVTQLLWDFNMTRNLVRQGEALARQDQQNLTAAQLNLIVGVKTAFYNYASALRVVKVDEANVANRQRQLNLANSMYKNGTGPPTDVDTAEASKSQGIFQLNSARNTAQQARITLLQQMGVNPLTPIVVTDESAPARKETDANALTDSALKARPEVRAAVEGLAAAKYGLSAAKAVDLPALYAALGVGLNGNSFPLTSNSANAEIGFQFPILDGGRRSGAVQAANGQIRTAEANLKTAALQVQTDVANAFMALQAALLGVPIANSEVANAAEDVRVAEGRYKAGIGTFQDITTAQALLLSAQTDQETARNTLDIARTNLQRATGELLNDIPQNLQAAKLSK